MESLKRMAGPEATSGAGKEGAGEHADVHASSEEYARRFAGGVGRWFLEVQAREALKAAGGEGAGRTVLDVGGGHGQLAGAFAGAGWKVTVFGSAEVCGERVKGLEGVEFRWGDVLNLPFEDGSFDTVLCFRWLTHCGHRERMVEELCRVARRRVVVDYPVLAGVNRLAPALFGAKRKLEGNTRAFELFGDAEVEGWFAACGWRRASLAKQFCLPMALHRSGHARWLSAAAEGVCRGLGLTRRWGSPAIASFGKGGAE